MEEAAHVWHCNAGATFIYSERLPSTWAELGAGGRPPEADDSAASSLWAGWSLGPAG